MLLFLSMLGYIFVYNLILMLILCKFRMRCPASKVVLRVRTYGQQGIEFALSGPMSHEKRSIGLWSLIVVFFLSSGGVLSTIRWDVSSSRLLLGLLLALLTATTYYGSGRVIVEESMLVVPTLGVKLSKRRRSGAITSEFVDLEIICGVAVTEAITFSNVVYLLVLLVEGQSDMTLPFQVGV
ncbi:hypothetical protein CCR75_004280 [Bremia lactucae]|uniref:Phosphatidylinositol N-acetylglucosaminyltransferase subunit H conserved domain-containing protein n=1 Tax=Bremia lactucae TaxID=4779 RepID=A0A976II25_BRELC|nr:hypothetical protein CCR75_004280 [Bremia lactucae]